MAYVARDGDGKVFFFPKKPRWDRDSQQWLGPNEEHIDDGNVYIYRGFPPVKPGECIKVRLEKVE